MYTDITDPFVGTMTFGFYFYKSFSCQLLYQVYARLLNCSFLRTLCDFYMLEYGITGMFLMKF